MLSILRPNKLKIIAALVVAATCLVVGELNSAAKANIWASVHPQITKEALLDVAPEEGSISLKLEAREIVPVSPVGRSEIEAALMKQWIAKVLVSMLAGYLASCVIVSFVRFER